MVYGEGPTPLLREAAARGAVTVDGREVLLGQAPQVIAALDKIEAARVTLRSLREAEYQTYWGFRTQQANADQIGLTSGETYYVVVDEDDSALSRRIVDALLPPFFRPPARIGLAADDPTLDFIVQDLRAARPQLPNLTTGFDAGTASQEAVDFLLARLYLNRAVYTTSTPASPSAGPYTFAGADMDSVIASVQRIIDNTYTDLSPYWDNFHWNNTTLSDELVFVKREEAGAGGNFTTFWWTLHYNNSPSGCCNGFVTLGDFYDLFEPADVRRGAYIPEMTPQTGVFAGFLIGQQYDSFPGPVTPGTPGIGALNDRGGNPLVFTPEVDLFYSNERMGIRVLKYPFNPAQFNEPGTDFIFFRYADALLMKAEAHFRKGENAAALTIVNQIRATDPNNRGASSLAAITEQDLLDERGRELYWEGWRRHDQIRFGAFTAAWEQKPASGAHRVMFPIPQRALDTNPNLVQIQGY